MKKIKAQISSDILRNILPLGAIDESREILNSKEATILYDLWKEGRKIDGKILIPTQYDRITVASLKTKGYLVGDGLTVNFTKRGQEVIKKFILDKEENAFKRG